MKTKSLIFTITLILIYSAISSYNDFNRHEKQIRYAYERGLFSGCVITLANDIAEVEYTPVDNLESTCLGVLKYAREKDFYSWDAKAK